jgi:hypothetical protein
LRQLTCHSEGSLQSTAPMDRRNDRFRVGPGPGIEAVCQWPGGAARARAIPVSSSPAARQVAYLPEHFYSSQVGFYPVRVRCLQASLRVVLQVGFSSLLDSGLPVTPGCQPTDSSGLNGPHRKLPEDPGAPCVVRRTFASSCFVRASVAGELSELLGVELTAAAMPVNPANPDH